MGASDYAWQHQLREWRHSPCLMRPVTFGMIMFMIFFWLVSALLTIPSWALGLLLAPLLSRGSWLIEFLYPLPIARWGHLLILRWSQPKMPHDDKAANYHTRTLEQRVEFVKGRVFVHPIPQLLDNLGYLVVCLPPPPKKPTTNVSSVNGASPLINVSVLTQQEPDANTLPKPPIVAFLVDCGDADTVKEQTQLILQKHYPQYPSIQIQMILSTHKHHDHTAGNIALKAQAKIGQHLDYIVGGAVERVPGCNQPVSDGDYLKLPSIGDKNDMNAIVTVEVVSVPAHTRGSVVYIMRPSSQTSDNTRGGDSPNPSFAFTGDTMFSGGGGVPFEADSDPEVDHGNYSDDAHGAIRAGVGMHAVERCFAEIMVRGMPELPFNTRKNPLALQNEFLIFPGHEYTTELLSRQFGSLSGGPVDDANKWKNYPPNVFFETASELYVALHRRSLPQATGKVLSAAPTTLRKELVINPHLRSLSRRAEVVVHAIRLWDAYFGKPKPPRDEEAAMMRGRESPVAPIDDKETNSSKAINARRFASKKTPPTEDRWNMDTHDAAKSIFTTVYTADLNAVIHDLARGKLNPEKAALRLEDLKANIKEPVVRRRPIPGTLPSERVVFKGLIGFALLGSKPSAMTLSDSHIMKMPPPIIRDMSCILVSKKRLIFMLRHFGFIDDSVDGHFLLESVNSLWQQAFEYANGTDVATTVGDEQKYSAVGKVGNGNDTTSDDEIELNLENDLIELGTLKWVLYGFPATQPTWFSKFCMPCSFTSSEKALQKRQDEKAVNDHPVKTSSMKRRHGELVRHDVMACKLCRNATGCPDNEREQEQKHEEDADESTILSQKSSLSARHEVIPHAYKATAGVDTLLEAADDDSFVDTSGDSAVEVSTLSTLMAKHDLLLEKAEEKIRL